MARYPGLMLWTDAWIADTHHLTVEQRGAYMDVLILMWRTPGCRVPNDDHWLAHHLGYTALQVANLVRPIISEFGTLVAGGDFVAQKRLQREFAAAHSRKEKAASAVRSRWAKKKGNAQVMQLSPAPAPAPEHSTVQGQGTVAEGPRSLACAPDGALTREAKEQPPPDPPELRQAAVDRVKTAMAETGFEFKPQPISNPANQSSSLNELEKRAGRSNSRKH